MIEAIELNVVPDRSFRSTDRPRSQYVQSRRERSGGVDGIQLDEGVFSLELEKPVIQVEVEQTEVRIWSVRQQTITVDYLVATSASILLRADNLAWWKVYPDTRGVLHVDPAVFIGTPRATDLVVGDGEVFAWAQSGGGRRLWVAGGRIRTSFLTSAPSANILTSDLAFDFGVGPVFQDGVGQYRLIVTSLGAVVTHPLS